MKHKLLSTLLAAATLLSLSVPAMAAHGMDAFEDVLYSDTPYVNPYSDIHGEWFARPVALYDQLGFMKGWNGKFDPHGTLTVAQALTVAARIHQSYQDGTCSIENGSPVWYQPFVDYCLEEGLCDHGMFLSWTDNITRNQMACVFSRVLPDYELGVLNESLDSYLDMDAPALYTEETLKLYRVGVLTGSDEFGSFYPLNPITRCEAAAIITRIALPTERELLCLLEPVVIAHQNAVVLALPQGFEFIDKQEKSVYLNAGLGISCTVTVTPHPSMDEQISDYITHQEIDDRLIRQIEQDGDTLYFPPHTESELLGSTEVCFTYCDVEHDDSVSRYPVQLVQVQFIIDGDRYQIEYRCIDDFYSAQFQNMVDNLCIDGTTLKQVIAKG